MTNSNLELVIRTASVLVIDLQALLVLLGPQHTGLDYCQVTRTRCSAVEQQEWTPICGGKKGHTLEIQNRENC